MYFKFIKFVVLLSLLVCCEFAGRILYSCLFNLAVQGKEPRHSMISSCSLFRLSTNLFFERKSISWRCILRAAVILRVWVCLFFSETGFNSHCDIYTANHFKKNLVSPQCQLLRNFTANFRFLYHSVAESLSPSSLLNNNKVLSLAVVIAPFKQTSSF